MAREAHQACDGRAVRLLEKDVTDVLVHGSLRREVWVEVVGVRSFLEHHGVHDYAVGTHQSTVERKAARGASPGAIRAGRISEWAFSIASTMRVTMKSA